MRAKIGRREKNIGRAERRTRRIAAFAARKSISAAKKNPTYGVRQNCGALFCDRNILWFNSARAKNGGFFV